MITIRKGEARGRVNRGWLDAYFTFSFAEYHDPAHMGYRALRVINDDRIAAGKGFGPHAHRDMEILTYVLEGHLLHRDSTGEQHIIGPNEIQAMSAGNGIVHSEFNASDEEPVHSIQIWIEPTDEDLRPSYQQISFDAEEKIGRFWLLAGPKKNNERVVTINQDAQLFVAELRPMQGARYPLAPNRYAWVQVLRGNVSLNGSRLNEGDGAAVSDEQELHLMGDAPEGGEVLLFDLQ